MSIVFDYLGCVGGWLTKELVGALLLFFAEGRGTHFTFLPPALL